MSDSEVIMVRVYLTERSGQLRASVRHISASHLEGEAAGCAHDHSVEVEKRDRVTDSPGESPRGRIRIECFEALEESRG